VGVSADYARKPWTLTEGMAVKARMMRIRASHVEADRNQILPLRVGDGDVKGFHETAIIPDVRDRSPEDAAQLIIDRLALISQDLVKSLRKSSKPRGAKGRPAATAPLAPGKVAHPPGSPRRESEKLKQEIQSRIESMDAETFECLCRELSFPIVNEPSPQEAFCNWLVTECAMDDAINAFAAMARSPGTKKETLQALSGIADRIIPLNFVRQFPERMKALLSASPVFFVEGSAGDKSTAEVMMAGYDFGPLRVDRDGFGETAIPALNVPNCGGGADAVIKGAVAFLEHVLAAIGPRFYDGASVVPLTKTLDQLATSLTTLARQLTKLHKRTIYALITLPAETRKREFMRKVIGVISERVSNVFFIEITNNLSVDDTIILHCIFSSRIR
jgi:hypothetical protein